jgi:hypothetical protein
VTRTLAGVPHHLLLFVDPCAILLNKNRYPADTYIEQIA